MFLFGWYTKGCGWYAKILGGIPWVWVVCQGCGWYTKKVSDRKGLGGIPRVCVINKCG